MDTPMDVEPWDWEWEAPASKAADRKAHDEWDRGGLNLRGHDPTVVLWVVALVLTAVVAWALGYHTGHLDGLAGI